MTTQGLARAAVLLMGMTFASRVLGFVREQFIAGYFGATGITDAFLVGNTLPNMLSGMLGTTMGLVFLPIYSRYLIKGDAQGAARIFNTVLAATSISSLLLIAVCLTFSSTIVKLIAPGLDPATLSQAVFAFQVIMPGTVFAILSYIVKAGLNAHGEFLAPGWSPIAQNVCIIAAIILLASTGVRGISIGTLVGTVAFLLVQVSAWRRHRLSLPLSFSLKDPELKGMALMALPVVATTLLAQAYQIFDRFFASAFPAGSVAALSFADRLRQLPIGIFSAVIATILYPRLSEAAARRDWEGFRGSLGRGVVLIALLTLPSAVVLAFLRVPVVRLLFEHGAFDVSATTATAGALLHYALGITFAGLNGLVLFAHYSILQVWDGLYVYGLTVGANLLLDLLLVRLLGPAGLALGNSLALALTFLLLGAALFWRLAREGAAAGGSGMAPTPSDAHAGFVRELAKVLLAAAIMALGVWRAVLLTPPAGAPSGLLAEVLAVAVPASLGLVVYVAALLLLKVQEAHLVVEVATRKLRNRR